MKASSRRRIVGDWTAYLHACARTRWAAPGWQIGADSESAT